MRRVKVMPLEDSFGLGLDFARSYLKEYKWWECEIYITLGNRYITIYINSRGLPIV